ncbi:MAG: hypothetical protein HRU15_01380 [Planctomycetes bacterium]|nr:hypothetical protein [Planctomycetota bacterium]
MRTFIYILITISGCFCVVSQQNIFAVDTPVPSQDSMLQAFSEQQIEFHGQYNGDDFWLRLLPADPKFAGGRILELLYSPYDKAQLAGALMVDHPQILLDKHLRVLAWKEGRGVHQTGLGNVVYRGDLKQPRYVITRELEDKEGEALADERAIIGAAGCDLQILPLLIACAYTAETNAETHIAIRVVDLFGGQHREQLDAQLTHGSCVFAKQAWVIAADDDGYVKKISDAQGKVLVEIAAFLKK